MKVNPTPSPMDPSGDAKRPKTGPLPPDELGATGSLGKSDALKHVKAASFELAGFEASFDTEAPPVTGDLPLKAGMDGALTLSTSRLAKGGDAATLFPRAAGLPRVAWEGFSPAHNSGFTALDALDFVRANGLKFSDDADGLRAIAGALFDKRVSFERLTPDERAFAQTILDAFRLGQWVENDARQRNLCGPGGLTNQATA